MKEILVELFLFRHNSMDSAYIFFEKQLFFYKHCRDSE